MTLNLMLTSKDAVYLSGDFRLISIKDQTALPDSYDTQKLIPVLRQNWAALIGYMGVASAPPLIGDVGQWIVEQVDSIPHEANFSELSRRLLRFNDLLDRIRGERRIAFSVVGFCNQRPFMMWLSNFLDAKGRPAEIEPRLRAYIRRSDQADVRSVGTARPDVFERVKLEKLLKAGSSRGSLPEIIRETAAAINANVARRSRGTISEECVTGYLLRTGSAVVGSHRIPDDAPCLPNWVRRDLERGGVIGFQPVDAADGKIFPIQWKETSARTSRGTVIRLHEINNAGKPIFDSQRFASAQGPDITGPLREALHYSRFMTRGGSADGADSFVLHPDADASICIVRCTR